MDSYKEREDRRKLGSAFGFLYGKLYSGKVTLSELESFIFNEEFDSKINLDGSQCNEDDREIIGRCYFKFRETLHRNPDWDEVGINKLCERIKDLILSRALDAETLAKFIDIDMSEIQSILDQQDGLVEDCSCFLPVGNFFQRVFVTFLKSMRIIF